MTSEDFKRGVIAAHGSAFDLENSEAELKSGIKLGFEYALNKQLERIGIAASLMATDNYIASVEHLVNMLDSDFRDKENYWKKLRSLEKAAKLYVHRHMPEDTLEEARGNNLAAIVAFQLAQKKFRLVMRLILKAGYLPPKDAYI
jgi:hypothetical protein